MRWSFDRSNPQTELQKRNAEPSIVTRSVSFEVALFAMYIVFESAKHEMKTKHETLLSLWESRALRPGEGPPRPLPRPTLPLRARCTTQVRRSNNIWAPGPKAFHALDRL
jgi:hypothetical protein